MLARMKIIQANKAYFPHVGGIETVVQQLAEGVIKRHDALSQVVVCNDRSMTSKEIRNGVQVTRVGAFGRIASLPISPGYPYHLLRQSGDILLIHEPFLLASLTFLARRKHARSRFNQLVIWWHSDIVRQRALAPIYTPLLRRILREADAVIAATPHHISSSQFLREVSHKCHTIHFGVDPKRFAESADLQQRVKEIKQHYSKPIILFTGRLVYYKGIQYLVEAMRHLPHAQLIAVGKGTLQAELEQIAANGHNNVTFIPFLEERDLVAMYKACDLFVLPSVEKSEAFGIVQLEAMACGKPVVTSDLPTGVTYVNQHAYTGLVVRPRDTGALVESISTLLSDNELRHRLGEQARQRVLREFTVDHMVDRTVDLFQALLG